MYILSDDLKVDDSRSRPTSWYLSMLSLHWLYMLELPQCTLYILVAKVHLWNFTGKHSHALEFSRRYLTTWQHESTLSLWFNLLKGKYKLKSSWTFSFVNNVFRWWLILIYFINKRDFVAVIFLLGMFQKIPSNLMASIIKLNIQMQTSMSLWKYLCRSVICQVCSSMHHQSLYSSSMANFTMGFIVWKNFQTVFSLLISEYM